MGRICSAVPLSMAELTYVLLGGSLLVYLFLAVRRLIRGPDRGRTAYRLLMTVLALALIIYGGFCLLWGVYYHAFDFAAVSGIQSGPVAREDLETVTAYFANRPIHTPTGCPA
jgi:bacteriorhodopsin